jgi:hypothetical protein
VDFIRTESLVPKEQIKSTSLKILALGYRVDENSAREGNNLRQNNAN